LRVDQQSPDKEHRRSWRGKMPRPWKRAQNASPTPAQYPEGGSIGNKQDFFKNTKTKIMVVLAQ